MTSIARTSVYALLNCLLGMALLSGCGAHAIDLAAVQQYAQTTALAATSFDAIADDYYQTCLRRREYAQPATVGGQQLSSKLPERAGALVAPSPGAMPTAINIGGDAECQDSSILAYRWQAENDVVVGYVRALGEAAGVDTTPQNFGDLAASLKSAGALNNDATATAAGNLATALVSSLLAARQRAAVRAIAQSAHDNGLGTLTSGLQFTALQYRGKLDLEHNAVASYYDTVLGTEEREFAVLECPATTSPDVRTALHCERYLDQSVGSHSPANSRVGSVSRDARAAQLRDMLRQQRLQRLDSFKTINYSMTAGQAYADAIGAIAAGNDALLKAPPNDLQAAVDNVKPFVDLLHDKVAAMIAALRK